MTAVVGTARVRVRMMWADSLVHERTRLQRGILSLQEQIGQVERQLSHARCPKPPLAQFSIDELLTRLQDEFARGEEERARLEQRARQRAHDEARDYEHGALLRRDRALLAQLFRVAVVMRDAQDIERVRATLVEVLSVSLGCEQVGLFERERERFRLTHSSGLSLTRSAQLEAGEDFIGRRIASGEPFVCYDGPLSLGAGERAEGLSVCLPLEAGGQVVAVLLAFGLPQTKPAFDEVDLELLDLLRARGGPLIQRALHLPVKLCAPVPVARSSSARLERDPKMSEFMERTADLEQ